MDSRDPLDLHFVLQNTYAYASEEWKRRHPDKPQPILTQTYRSVKRQNELYAKGRTVKGDKATKAKPMGQRVTNARGGESPHNYKPSMALDIAFINKEGKLDWTVELFRLFYEIVEEQFPEIEWGGLWKMKDYPHFEIRNWKKMVGACPKLS